MPKAKNKKNRDFQKVRFKVGKKLPKAANYTETRFKVAQIQVYQKLHQGVASSEPTTHRKLNIKDLLSQLHHHSSRVRGDAITGLLELLNSDENLAVTYLSSLVNKLAPIFYDSDSDVRRMCATLFHKIISVLSMQQLSPFVRTIFAHLGCAMTHIDEPIQLDSLKFIDTFIDGPPELLSIDSGTILKNFIELIAKYHSSSSRVSLVADPVSKRASQKWRQKILKRLDKFLSVQLTAISEPQSKDKAVEITCDGRTPVYHQPQSLTSHLLTAALSYSLSTQGSDVSRKVIVQYTPKLMRLLHETWTDIMPSRPGKHHSKGVMVQSDTAVTLLTIASLTTSLLSMQSIVTSDHNPLGSDRGGGRDGLRQLCVAMVDAFPVSQVAEQDPTAKAKGKNNVSSTQLNLSICDVLCRALMYKEPTHFTRTSLDLVLSYVRDLTHADDMLTMAEMTTFLSVCGQLLKKDFPDVMQHVTSWYERAHQLSQQKKALLVYITNLLTDSQYKQYLGHPSLPSFVQSLPAALDSVAGTSVAMETVVLEGLKVAGRHGMVDMSQCIHTLIDTVLSRILPENTRALIDLFYHCPIIHRDSYARLSQIITQQTLPKDTTMYLIHILQYRCVNRHAGDVHAISDYLSFDATVLLGELTGLSDARKHSDMWDVAPLSKDLEPYYNYHCQVSKDLCQQLTNLLNVPLADVLLTAIFTSLEKCTKVNLWSVAAVFGISNAFCPTDIDNKNHVTTLSIAVLRSLVSNNSTIPTETNKELLVDVKRFLFSSDDSLQRFFSALKVFSDRGDMTYDEGCQVTTFLLRLLQASASTTARLNKSHINDVLSLLQSRCGEVSGLNVWSELQYALSIV